MEQIEYQTIGARLRPPRVVVAYRGLSNWAFMGRQVIGSLSGVWGGAGAAVLPVNDHGALPEALLPLLRAYDPDHVAVHETLVADLAVVEPGVADRLVKRAGLEGETADATWARLANEPVHDGPWELIAKQTDEWCSPFKGFRQEARSFDWAEVGLLHRDGKRGAGLSLLPTVPGEVVYTLA